MRGTILLLDRLDSRATHAESFRTAGLLVSEATHLENALKLADTISPDVIVIVFDPHLGASAVSELRRVVDHATSIIVVANPEDCEPAHGAGADLWLMKSALPNEVLYEIHRALILRRSGRRLPEN